MRVMSGSVCDLPILMLQDPADAQGALVYDCRPPLLPVSLQLCDLGTLAGRQPEVSASMAVPPWEEGPLIGDVDSDMLVFPELGIAPLITPIVDPVVDSMVSPAAYPEPPIPVVLVDEPVPVLESSPLQEVADSPVRECSPSFHASPVGYGPIPSPISPSLRITNNHGPSLRMVTMDQYLPRMGAPFGEGSRRTLLFCLGL